MVPCDEGSENPRKTWKGPRIHGMSEPFQAMPRKNTAEEGWLNTSLQTRCMLSTIMSNIFDFLFLGKALYQRAKFWLFLQNLLLLGLFTRNFQAALQCVTSLIPTATSWRSRLAEGKCVHNALQGLPRPRSSPWTSVRYNVNHVSCQNSPNSFVSNESFYPSPNLIIFSPASTNYILPVLPNHKITFL